MVDGDTPTWTLARVAGWVLGTFAIIFLVGVAGGFLAAHFDHGSGARLWGDRLKLAVPVVVFAILAAVAALALRRSWPKAPAAAAGEWEHRAAERRRRTLIAWGLPGIAGAVTMLALSGAAAVGVGTTLASVLIGVAIVAGLVAAGASTIYYLRVIDEQERLANLWCGYVAFAAYLFLYMAQLLGRQLDPALPRFDDAIFGITAVVAVATFLRLRFR